MENNLVGVLAVLFLILANGFFVAAEFSLVGARRTRIEQLVQEGNAAALAAQKVISRLDSYVAATQLGITLASLALGWVGEPALSHIFEQLLPESIAHLVGPGVIAGIVFAFVTFMHIILGELVPKSIALQRPEDTALIVAQPMRVFHSIFRPIIALMNSTGNWITRLLGFQPAGEHGHVHSPQEIEMLVHSSREAGLVEEKEETLVRRVFDFTSVQARQVMIPRTEISAIASDAPLAEVLKMIASLHYSRYPVYQESVDTVIGILHTKDLLEAIAQHPSWLTDQSDAFKLAPILRPALFVPQLTGVDTVLDQMQKAQQQMAIVIDEFGGMAGVLTMEDILEELVGEVQDEFDSDANQIETHGETLMVDGLMTMSDVIERFGAPSGEFMSTTLGGYIAEKLDRIAVVGDTVPFGGYDLHVEEMDGLRAAKIRFTRQEHRPVGSADGASPQMEKTDGN